MAKEKPTGKISDYTLYRELRKHTQTIQATPQGYHLSTSECRTNANKKRTFGQTGTHATNSLNQDLEMIFSFLKLLSSCKVVMLIFSFTGSISSCRGASHEFGLK